MAAKITANVLYELGNTLIKKITQAQDTQTQQQPQPTPTHTTAFTESTPQEEEYIVPEREQDQDEEEIERSHSRRKRHKRNSKSRSHKKKKDSDENPREEIHQEEQEEERKSDKKPILKHHTNTPDTVLSASLSADVLQTEPVGWDQVEQSMNKKEDDKSYMIDVRSVSCPRERKRLEKLLKRQNSRTGTRNKSRTSQKSKSRRRPQVVKGSYLYTPDMFNPQHQVHQYYEMGDPFKFLAMYNSLPPSSNVGSTRPPPVIVAPRPPNPPPAWTPAYVPSPSKFHHLSRASMLRNPGCQPTLGFNTVRD